MSFLRRLGRRTLTAPLYLWVAPMLPLFWIAAMVESYRARNDGEDPDADDAA